MMPGVLFEPWAEGDFVEVGELKRAFGYLAATNKAELTISNVAIGKSGSGVGSAGDIGSISFEVRLLR